MPATFPQPVNFGSARINSRKASAWVQVAPTYVYLPKLQDRVVLETANHDAVAKLYPSFRLCRYARACRWVAVRTPLPSGKVVLQRQRVCGFKIPARDQPR
jgi:hypothetical protein